MRIGRHVRVSGRVQGVFFRAWTRDQACALGIAGWVRNCADGSVEAHLTGEAAQVDQLLEMVRRGPPSALVARLDVRNVAPEASEGFEIRR